MQDLAESVTTGVTTAHSSAGSLTHRVRPGIEPATSWFLVGFISAAPRWELLAHHFLMLLLIFFFLAKACKILWAIAVTMNPQQLGHQATPNILAILYMWL